MDQLWLFFTLTFLLSASPGPLMLGCMSDGARFGFGPTVFTMLGASLGNLLLMLLSAIGLGFLVAEAAWVFNLIKWIGAAYLVYLGVMIFIAPVGEQLARQAALPSHHLFLKGFLISVTNPKGLIYFGALFPQFINVHNPVVPQFTIMTLVFLSLDFIWMSVYALSGKQIMRWLTAPVHQRWFNRASGSALIAAGGALSLAKP